MTCRAGRGKAVGVAVAGVSSSEVCSLAFPEARHRRRRRRQARALPWSSRFYDDFTPPFPSVYTVCAF